MAEAWYARLILQQVSGYAFFDPRPPIEDVDRYAAVLIRTARALKPDVEDTPAPVAPVPKPKDSPGGAEAPVPEEETAARHWRELGPWKTLPIPPEAPVLKLRPATDVLTGLTPGIVDLLKEAQKPRPTPPSDDHIRALKERLAQQMPHAADEFSLAVTRRTLAGAFRALLRRARGRS